MSNLGKTCAFLQTCALVNVVNVYALTNKKFASTSIIPNIRYFHPLSLITSLNLSELNASFIPAVSARAVYVRKAWKPGILTLYHVASAAEEVPTPHNVNDKICPHKIVFSKVLKQNSLLNTLQYLPVKHAVKVIGDFSHHTRYILIFSMG